MPDSVGCIFEQSSSSKIIDAAALQFYDQRNQKEGETQ
jgi:hypothetical protein